jgi:phenylalanyl-tRNA synthetase beta chain
MIGVAREAAALFDLKLKLPPLGMQANGPPIAGQVAVRIDDPRLCARYAAAIIKNVTIGPAPGWMQRRLLYAGMRPISNLVDITNYVMLEWGQPLHAFDYDLLVARAGGKEPTIIVRPARAGEILVTLDGQERKLAPENLIIADTAGPIALAGVMGGRDTEVSTNTKNVLLESANFDFVSIRRTMKQFNLPSEASARFSRGVHPETAKPAAERAAELMRQYAGGTIAAGLVDSYPAPRPAQVVELQMSQVRRLLGMDFPLAKAERILRALEFEVTAASPNALRAVVPPHRLDIQEGPADLIEELVRIHGYDRLPEALLSDRLPRQRTNEPLVFEERLRDLLVGAGLQEVVTYSLTTPEKEAPLGALAAGTYVQLLNPISSERTVMRRTVLAGVLDVAASNLRHTDNARFFELGPVYLLTPGEKLPQEPRRLGMVLTGVRTQPFWGDSPQPGLIPKVDFHDFKGIMEALAGDLHLANVRYEPAKAAYLHPSRSATLWAGDRSVGDFGELHPSVAEAFGLGERTVLVGELDIEALQSVTPGGFTYTPVPRFPAALRDIAVVVEEKMPAETVAAEIRAGGGELLQQVRLFDLYRGESVPPGTKSLAYALSYQAPDRTLTDKEVDRAHKKIEDRLKHRLKAQIRGKD